MQSEKRRFPRIKIKCKMIIACEGKVLFGQPEDYFFHVFSEDLSEVGVMVKLEQQLTDSAIVKVSLFITSNLLFKCKGSVVWTKQVNPEDTKPDIFETGIKFLELDYSEQEMIANLVKDFLKK